jgi:hypothetical protein
VRLLQKYLTIWNFSSITIDSLEPISKDFLVCFRRSPDESILADLMVLTLNPILIGESLIIVHARRKCFLVMKVSVNSFKFVDRSMAHWLFSRKNEVMHACHFCLVVL